MKVLEMHRFRTETVLETIDGNDMYRNGLGFCFSPKDLFVSRDSIFALERDLFFAQQ